MSDSLKHHGVLGMKWGVRKDKPRSSKSGSSQNDNKVTSLIKSTSRELSNYKDLTKMKNMTTKSIKAKANRLGLENELKKYSRRSAKNVLTSTSKTRKDYLNRSKMSDQELKRKVDRLRSQHLLQKKVVEANASNIQLGKKVVAYATPFVVGYATARAPSIVKKIKDPAVRDAINAVIKIVNR